MKIQATVVKTITFTEEELLWYTKQVWNNGFTNACNEWSTQRDNPEHPITRAMTMADKRYWEGEWYVGIDWVIP